VLAAVVVSILAQAQLMPDFGPAFPQDEVAVVSITIDPDSLQQMLDNLENEHYYPATFHFESSVLDETIEGVGFRLRGNTSLASEKKSFKISFNSFTDGGDWQDLEKMNLVAQQNDPSMMRSKLCHDSFRHFGIKASRTSYTKLYINDEYKGLYLNIEHIDEEFAKKYFDEQGDGNLYKCTYPATLEYLGSSASEYQFEMWGSRPYDLQTNQWSDNYGDLAHFIDVLNNTPLAELPCELPIVFNVEAYLKTAALDVLLGNWDGYIYNKNNFYLYNDQRTGQINYIPYDLDNTLGIDWVDQDWTERNIYNWAPSGDQRPLFKRLLQVPEYRDKFSQHIEAFCTAYFNASNITAVAQGWQDLIADAAQEDPYRPLDFGFTYEDFLDAISTSSSLGPQVDYGIAEYVSERRSNGLDQLEDYDVTTAIVSWVQNEALVEDADDVVIIDALIEGAAASECDLMISNDALSWTNVGGEFTDNGEYTDVAGDKIYSYFSANAFGSDKLYYKTSCDGEDFPCDNKFLWTSASGTQLFINEVMASNTSFVADDAGEYDDWLELYNAGSGTINLTGKYLTDDLTNWNKFALPAVGITTGQFRIVWLDNDPEQGSFHSTFKIGNDETDLWLIALEEGVPRIVDHFNPVSFVTDSSSERTTDGGATIALTNTPTFGTTNSFVGINEMVNHNIRPYPNPAADIIQIGQKVTSARLLDATGRVIMNCVNVSSINISGIESGAYFLSLDGITISQLISR